MNASIHHVQKITTVTNHFAPGKDNGGRGFWRRKIVVTDAKGNQFEFSLIADTEDALAFDDVKGDVIVD